VRAKSVLASAVLAATAALAQVDTAWVRRFNGAGDSTDWPAGLAVTSEGGVYVTGYSFADDTVDDFMTLYYDTHGTVAWARRYDGRGDTSSRAVALAVDGENNCYVTGKTWLAGGRYDWMTAKHDTEGIVEWTTYHSGTLAENDEPRAAVAYPGGGVVVTGASFGPAGNWDFTTIRYSAAGDTLWAAYHKRYRQLRRRSRRAGAGHGR